MYPWQQRKSEPQNEKTDQAWSVFEEWATETSVRAEKGAR
jgi:hypothetical protein